MDPAIKNATIHHLTTQKTHVLAQELATSIVSSSDSSSLLCYANAPDGNVYKVGYKTDWCRPVPTKPEDNRGMLWIHQACEDGSEDLVQNFITHGHNFDVDIKSYEGKGSTPIQIATQKGWMRIVVMLIQAKADTAMCLTAAAYKGDIQMMDLFFENGETLAPTPYFHTFSGKTVEISTTPITRAIAGGKLKAVEHLYSKGDNPNILHNDGTTPFHFAALNPSEDVIIYLLTVQKMNPNQVSNFGHTPFSQIVETGKITEGMVLAFLENGANPNHPTPSGNTVFALLINNNKVTAAMVQACLKRGANAMVKYNGRPLIHVAVDFGKGNADVVGLLARLPGIKVDEVHENGTALSMALYGKTPMLIKTLLNSGANPNLELNSLSDFSRFTSYLNDYKTQDVVELTKLFIAKGAKFDEWNFKKYDKYLEGHNNPELSAIIEEQKKKGECTIL